MLAAFGSFAGARGASPGDPPPEPPVAARAPVAV